MRKEFIVRSVCTHPGADPRHNAWSGLHTRLSAEILSRNQRVDGVMIWDMVCGTIGRPCPEVAHDPDRETIVGHYAPPPPCIYLFPATIPSPRHNPNPPAQSLDDVLLLKAFNDCFQGKPAEINYVTFAIEHRGADTLRTARISRDVAVQRESNAMPIPRA
jgi:hypothetical protein